MKLKKYQYTYFAYGLTISSQFPISGFSGTISDNPGIVIKMGQTPDRLQDVRNQSRFFQSNDEEYLLRVRNIATYYITCGNTVVVQPEIKADMEEISAYLGGMVMGAIFHQRGLLPLHGSSVVYNDRCFIFAGNAGSGKSTLAALFIKSGAKLVADDISLIGFSNNIPVIYPAFPYIKAWKYNLNLLGINSDNLQKVPLEKEKYYLPVHEFAESYNHIDNIFFIESHKKNTIEATKLTGIQKFIRFKKYGYLANSINNTIRERTLFKMTNTLVSEVPAILILRPESEFNIDQLMSVALYHMD